MHSNAQSLESQSFHVQVTSSPAPANGDAPEVDLGEFVRSHYGNLTARALWLTRDQAEAMDLLQDTFERALTASKRNIPRERMKSWLLVIMHNLFLDRRRAQLRRATCALTDQIVDVVSRAKGEPEDAALWETHDVESIRALLPQLPECLRGAFELYAEGRQYAEIASTLGIPSGTVATRIHRARRLMRELVKSAA